MDGGITEAALLAAAEEGGTAAAADAAATAAAEAAAADAAASSAGAGAAGAGASEAAGISGAPYGLSAGALPPEGLGGMLGASEAAGISGAPYGTSLGSMPPPQAGLLSQIGDYFKPGGAVNKGLDAYGRARTAMGLLSANQHPAVGGAAPARAPQGPPPIPASQIFGQQTHNPMMANSAGMVGTAMGSRGASGGMDPQLLQILLRLRGMA